MLLLSGKNQQVFILFIVLSNAKTKFAGIKEALSFFLIEI